MFRALLALLRRNLPGIWERRMAVWTILALALVQFWTIVSWPKVHEDLAALPDWQRAAVSLALVWGFRVFPEDELGPGAWERMLSPLQRLAMRLPLLAACALPLWFFSLLFPGNPAARALLWTVGAWGLGEIGRAHV